MGVCGVQGMYTEYGTIQAYMYVYKEYKLSMC